MCEAEHEHNWKFDYLSLVKLGRRTKDGELPREMEIQMRCGCGDAATLSGKVKYQISTSEHAEQYESLVC